MGSVDRATNMLVVTPSAPPRPHCKAPAPAMVPQPALSVPALDARRSHPDASRAKMLPSIPSHEKFMNLRAHEVETLHAHIIEPSDSSFSNDVTFADAHMDAHVIESRMWRDRATSPGDVQADNGLRGTVGVAPAVGSGTAEKRGCLGFFLVCLVSFLVLLTFFVNY